MTEDALIKWHDESQRPHLEDQCKKDCPQYAAAGMKGYDWFFDAHTTERMYAECLDAFNVTKGCCDRGCEDATDDGEHYAGLDAELATNMAFILGQQLQQAQ